MNKYPFVRQEGIKDCGVSCLLMIIKYYNGYIPLEKLRYLTDTNKLGVSAYNLCNAACEIGFSSEGIKTNIQNLCNKDIYLPCIAHVIINNYQHYIVIYKVNYKKKYLIIADPASKIKKMTFNDFSKIWDGIIINLYPKRNIPIENDESISSFIIKYMKPHRKLLISCLLLSILVTISSSLLALYFRVIIDSINTSKAYLLFILIIFLLITFIKTINNFFRNKQIIYLNKKLDMNMSCDIYNKIIDLPYRYYRNRSTGEIVSRFNDLNNVKNIIAKILLTVFIDLPLAIVCLILLFKININLSFIVIIFILIYSLIFIVFNYIINRNINKIQKLNADNISFMVESINGFETLKNLNILSRFKYRFEEKYYNFVMNKFKFDSIVNYEYVINELLFDVGSILILYFGSLYVFNNTFSIGTLLMFYTLSNYLIDSIKNIINLNKDYIESKNSLKRVVEIFVPINDTGIVSKFTNGGIEIKNLDYRYNNEIKVLKNINLKINKGEKVLITGDSGSGKSTLLKILMKYYLIDNTKVFIDDIDLNFYSNDTIRNNIKYISQNEILFSDTLLSNLNLYADAGVNKVVKLCEIDKIINKHNINFNYILEENGFNLSGGEKQRIILGRTLLQNFKILLIDEGLNQMDVNLERRILKKLFAKYSDKTIIVVSHRLDNMDLYDHYIELMNGYIVKDVYKNE